MNVTRVFAYFPVYTTQPTVADSSSSRPPRTGQCFSAPSGYGVSLPSGYTLSPVRPAIQPVLPLVSLGQLRRTMLGLTTGVRNDAIDSLIERRVAALDTVCTPCAPANFRVTAL